MQNKKDFERGGGLYKWFTVVFLQQRMQNQLTIGAKSPHQKQKYFSIFFYAQEICGAKDPFGDFKLTPYSA
jgi:hypothetical protein